MLFKKIRLALLFLLLASCAGIDRSCASGCAEAYGADWLIVQYAADGHPLRCWKLQGTSVTNEPHSDGIYWKSPGGHLVHISGWYNRVQIAGGNSYEGPSARGKRFQSAAGELGIDLATCL